MARVMLNRSLCRSILAQHPRVFRPDRTRLARGIATVASSKGRDVDVHIIYYSMYGHIHKLALAQQKGVQSVEGVQGTLYQVPETLPEEVLRKMNAPPKPDDPLATVQQLPTADGFLFGLPTRYGNPPAQFKAFWDATGGLWKASALAGKPFGIFFSTGSQGGGQETTALTALPNFVHHGMLFCAPGYSFDSVAQSSLDQVQGGSAYGAGTFAGPDGSRVPTEYELRYATFQGRQFAQYAKKLAADT